MVLFLQGKGGRYMFFRRRPPSIYADPDDHQPTPPTQEEQKKAVAEKTAREALKKMTPERREQTLKELKNPGSGSL